MTIGQHISNLRGLINLYSRTKESFSDQALYEFLKTARAKILEDLARNFRHMSEWNWKTYCAKLIKAKPHNCNCIPDYLEQDCLVVRTEYPVPRPLHGRNGSLMDYYTIGGQKISIYTLQEWMIYKSDDIRSKELAGTIMDGYLYIWNNTKLKLIRVKVVPADPTVFADIPQCNEEGDVVSETCYDVYDQDFYLDEGLRDATYKLALELMKIPLQIPQDQTNDSNQAIKN